MSIFKILKKRREEDYNYLISKEAPLSYEAEAIQKSLINFEYVNIDGRFKVVQFTSAVSGEGKTTVISNFCYLLGQKKKVLVIDLDLRKPKLHHVFNVSNEKGLTDYLLDKIELKEAIRHSEEFNFDYLLSGEKTTAINSILSADKLKNLIQSLKEQYDYIFIDAPPVLPVADSLLISKFVDGIIFVNAYGVVNKTRILEAFNSLKFTGTTLIGSIMTQAPNKNNRNNKESYYYYE